MIKICKKVNAYYYTGYGSLSCKYYKRKYKEPLLELILDMSDDWRDFHVNAKEIERYRIFKFNEKEKTGKKEKA